MLCIKMNQHFQLLPSFLCRLFLFFSSSSSSSSFCSASHRAHSFSSSASFCRLILFLFHKFPYYYAFSSSAHVYCFAGIILATRIDHRQPHRPEHRPPTSTDKDERVAVVRIVERHNAFPLWTAPRFSLGHTSDRAANSIRASNVTWLSSICA